MIRLIILVLASFAALPVKGQTGYLAVVGPAPLRFEGRLRPVPRALALLPPLIMQEPLVVVTNLASAAGTNAALPVLTITPGVTNTVGTPPLVTNAPVVVLPEPVLLPTGPLLTPMLEFGDSSRITAQMLIQYFRPQGTNGAVVNVLTPGFIPPHPATPPSSTARYSTTP